MTFSIRTFFIAISVVAIWLAAIVSKSPLLIEIVANATCLLIVLMLAFAIWAPRPEQRAFWTGFFVLAFGNLVMASQLATYQQTGYQVAHLLIGQPNQQVAGTPYGLQWTPATTTNSIVFPYAVNNMTGTYSYTLSAAGNQGGNNQQIEAVRGAVPVMVSLVLGVIGGWLTLWISQQRDKSATDGNGDPKTGNPSPP